jgi:hypothetical protein
VAGWVGDDGSLAGVEIGKRGAFCLFSQVDDGFVDRSIKVATCKYSCYTLSQLMKALILHLSDLHIHAEDNVVQAKIGAVAKAIQNEEVQLDGVAVVVSGDIAFSGKPDEYSVAAQYFRTLAEDLGKRLKTSEVRFVFVPGNHDCDFTLSNSVRDMVISGIRTGSNKGVDGSMIACCCCVQKHFFSFRDAFPTGKPNSSQWGIYWEYVWPIENYQILFRCFNTAWVSQLKEQQGTLSYPEEYLTHISRIRFTSQY